MAMSSSNPLRGDIYWSNLEPVKGSEQGGFRPVFIVSNNLMNKTAPFVMGIPITRPGDKVKNHPFNVEFQANDWDITQEAIDEITQLGHGFAGKGGFLLCNQTRAFSKERLLVKMGVFKNNIHIDQIEDALIHSLGLSLCTACDSPLRPNSTHCPNPRCQKRHHQNCTCGRNNPLNFKYCPDCGRSGRQ